MVGRAGTGGQSASNAGEQHTGLCRNRICHRLASRCLLTMLFINWVVPSQQTNRYRKSVDQFSPTAAHNRCADPRLEYNN
jgi:hypothetical protein